MLTFNTNNIFTGQVKQILHSFNLPYCKVLVDGEKVIVFEGLTYLYKNLILIANKTKEHLNGFVYDEDDFEFSKFYDYGDEILNITHRLPIKNNYYDALTHEALGNYLRFVKAHKDLDLMSMYNCFNGQTASNVEINTSISSKATYELLMSGDSVYLSGKDIWNVGNNFYQSSGSRNYVLKPNSSVWQTKIWGDLTNFSGQDVWTDGNNIYYSSGSSHYVLNVNTSIWEQKTWLGLTRFQGRYVWENNGNIYYSEGSNQYILDKSTDTWDATIWEETGTGQRLLPLATNIWKDNTNVYYSSFGDYNEQYVLNQSGTWDVKTWNGFDELDGFCIWTDGNNIYYSYGDVHKILNRSTDTWEDIVWFGLTNFIGQYVWENNGNIYYSNITEHYELNKSSIHFNELNESWEATWSLKNWELLRSDEIDIQLDVDFLSKNSAYKLYTVPVKFFKKYTIAIDCLTQIEVMPVFYRNGNLVNSLNVLGTNIIDILYNKGYKKYGGCRFNEPILYDKLYNIFDTINNANNRRTFFNKELELKLLIKVPEENSSSLVVLEGDYTNVGGRTFTKNAYSNYTTQLVDYKHIKEFDNYISMPQLLYMNDGVHHPFADRLYEYISENAITNCDEIPTNVKMAEVALLDNKVINKYTKDFDWTNELRARIYLNAMNKKLLDTKKDVLGYVDKDIEKDIIVDYKYSTTLEG